MAIPLLTPWKMRLPVREATKWLLFSCLVITASPARPNSESTADKHVVIDKTTQTLRAYEGNKIVLESRVSTGRTGRTTPNGKFLAGDKFLMHRSRLYHNAPMPFSVHVTGNYFIHGYKSVPNYPASHGCIRLPLSDGNPAKRFYYWVEPGTPIEIAGRWRG